MLHSRTCQPRAPTRLHSLLRRFHVQMQAVTASPSAAAPANPAGQSIAEYVTALHNNYRGLHVDTPPLTWDGGIAAIAQAWAGNCVFQHSVRTVS